MNYPQIAAGVYQACAAYDQYLPELTEPVARAWAKVFERFQLTAEDLVAAVDQLYATQQSGFKPLPGDIAKVARAIRQDRRDRAEPTTPDGERVQRPALEGPDADRAAQARLAAITALAREKALEAAETPQTAPAGRNAPVGVNPLLVSCDHCRVQIGHHCVVAGTSQRLTKTDFHDSRWQKAKRAAGIAVDA